GLDWRVPDFSTLSRRQKRITVQITSRRAPGPLNLLVDSTGIKFLGDGEWLARKHGPHRRRQYRKVHLAMDTATGDIRAVEFTSSREGDSPVLPDLLNQIPEDEQIGTVTGDGAFDTRRCHTAILDRGGTAIIPIRRTGRLWKEDCPAARARNEILRATQRLGRAIWKRWSGYHVRSRIEARMRCLKAFGERISSRDPDRQTAEIHIRIALMNPFTALGSAQIKRVACTHRGKRILRPHIHSHYTAATILASPDAARPSAVAGRVRPSRDGPGGGRWSRIRQSRPGCRTVGRCRDSPRP